MWWFFVRKVPDLPLMTQDMIHYLDEGQAGVAARFTVR
jgi:hypothetical protein